MNKAAIDVLYNWAKSTGFNKPLEDFVGLIQSNKDAFSKVYSAAKESGFSGDEAMFAGVLGVNPNSGQAAGPNTGGESQGPSKSYAGDITPMMAITPGTIIKELPSSSGRMTVSGPGDPNKKIDVSLAPIEAQPKLYEMILNSQKSASNLLLSEGYREKIDNETAMSKEIMKKNPGYMMRDTPTSAPTAFQPYTYSDSDKLYNERIASLNAPVEVVDTPKRSEAMAYNTITSEYLNDEDWQNDVLTRTSNKSLLELHFLPYMLKNNEGDYTNREEEFHKTHRPEKRHAEASRFNITPYAYSILEENVPKHNKDYLKTPTEVIAKKNVLETWLVDQGQMMPGEKVNESHFDYIQKNLINLPRAAMDFWQLIQEEGSGNETNKEKQAKNREAALRRFMTITNEIAATEKDNNQTYTV